MRRQLGLRGRLAIAAATAIALAVVLLGVALILVVDERLNATLDDTLRDRAGQVARLAVTTPALLTSPGALESRLGGREVLVQVVDRRDRLVARSAALGARVLRPGALQAAAIQRGESGYADLRLGDEPLRAFVAPLPDAGGGGAVIVASSTADIEATLGTIRGLVAILAFAAAALAALLAALLARRALRPLTRLSGAAEAIEATGDPARRLPEPRTSDEVGRLAETLNAMLASLERAREGERRFVADASHELRTPLTALRGNAAYVARHGADQEVLADLEADAARLARMLDDLLALAREDAAHPPAEVVRVDELAKAIVAGRERVVLEPAEPVAVRGEPTALERALANLVTNAQRHGPADGEVRVSVARSGDGEGDDDGAEDHRDEVRITVADEGPGLEPDQVERAFERFWRAPGARGEGSGLGLALVRTTAERHGGRVEVDGARFTLVLPALRDLSEPGSTLPRTGQRKDQR